MANLKVDMKQTQLVGFAALGSLDCQALTVKSLFFCISSDRIEAHYKLKLEEQANLAKEALDQAQAEAQRLQQARTG